MKKPNQIFDNRLFIPLDLTPTDKINDAFREDKSNLEHLTNQLLIYDKIIIPTKDFGILPVLISWMGLKNFEEAIECNTFSFVRPSYMLGYAGNGNGLQMMTIHEGNASKLVWHQETTFGEFEKAPELQLKNCCPSLNAIERNNLIQRVLSLSKEFKFDNTYTFKQLSDESYKEIMYDGDLSRFVLSKENNPFQQVKLTHLKGVDANQLRILNRFTINDGIDLVLRVAQTNMEIALAYQYEQSDLNISHGGEKFLKNKFKRLGMTVSKADALISLLELNKLPDIGAAVTTNNLHFDEYWKLRNSKEAVKFREWLKIADPQSKRDLEKLYVEALGKQSWIERTPSKLIRFVISSVVGALNPVAGLGLGIVDSFFVDKWLKGYSPKLFIDELHRLPFK